MFTGTKESVKQTRNDINAALLQLSKVTGLDFSIGTIRFDANGMRTTLTGVKRGAGGTSTTTAATTKTVNLAIVGKQVLGQAFNEADKYHSLSLGTVKIVGYNSRAKAYPFIVQTTGGKNYKITTLAAKSLVAAGAV